LIHSSHRDPLRLCFLYYLLEKECFDYDYIDGALSYDLAAAKCVELGGRLVSSRDDYHFKIIKRIATTSGLNLMVNNIKNKKKKSNIDYYNILKKVSARTINGPDQWLWLNNYFLKITSSWWSENPNDVDYGYSVRCSVLADHKPDFLDVLDGKLLEVDCTETDGYICEYGNKNNKI
jgi:hypothetical protein